MRGDAPAAHCRASRAGSCSSSSSPSSCDAAADNAGALGASTRTIEWQVVVLPQPDSPTRPIVSPASRLKAHPVDRLHDAGAAEAEVVGLQILDAATAAAPAALLAIAQLRIETHAQPVAQHVGRQHQHA